MLKEQSKLISQLNICFDLVLLVGSFFLAYWLCSFRVSLAHIYDYVWLLLVILPVWLILLRHFGFYGSKRISGLSDIAFTLMKVHLIGGVISSSAIYFLEPRGFSRGFFGIFLLVSFLLLFSEQLLTRLILSRLRRSGYNSRNIILVGTQYNIIELVELHRGWGLHILGVIQPQDGPLLQRMDGYPVLGRLADIVEICKEHPVDEVIFCTSKQECRSDLERYVLDLAQMGVIIRMVLNLYYTYNARKELSLFHGELPLMTLYPKTFDAGQLFLKRCLDIAGACVGLAVTICLFPFIALAIKLESPGPVIFGQTRVRENGRTFTCWKFRSMHQDADARKQELMHLNEMNGAIFKIKHDPRITGVGRFLRKTSLDELPQFWNVFKGEMSLVGTRPPTPEEVKHYENWQRRRICIKPGITGLWQVSGRNQIQDFDEIVRLDLDYIDRWSLSLDFILLLKTLKVVFIREGAR